MLHATHPELYIISDLHLCDGSRVEDFRADDERALVSFLFRLGRSTGTTLVINGDFIDFVQIQPRPQMWFNATLDASEAESLEKLERALLAHAPVFDALSRFVASGHQLRFHAGNHDIDLLWPRVQQRLRERIAPRALHGAITFGTYYHEGGLYIEHGHQADPPNSFPDEPNVIHSDPNGVARLERCWGTRLVEEFYNRIEVLDGCDMLDNVRPRLQAALIIIKHAILDRRMHATLYSGVQVILETLANLETDQDVVYAADQLGINKHVLGWLVSVAGWLGVGARGPHVAKSAVTPLPGAPSLQRAYAYGTAIRDGAQLAHLAPPVLPDRATLAAKGIDGVVSGQVATVQQEYNHPIHAPFIRRAAAIATQTPHISAICFGHTHQAIGAALQVDREAGWPLPRTAARYFNSGSWTRTLNLADLSPEQQTFEYLLEPRHFRAGRDYLRVTWPYGAGLPQVETSAWG